MQYENLEDEELDASSLSDLLNEWIKNDPDLGGHFMMQPLMGDFRIIAICANSIVAWFADDGKASTWTHLDDEVIRFNPADPKFFDEVRTHLIDAHNSKTVHTPKGNTWHTRRLGCTTQL